MEGNSIDDVVMQYYTQQSLSPDVIALLQAKTESVKAAQRVVVSKGVATLIKSYRRLKADYRLFQTGYRYSILPVCFALIAFAMIPMYFMQRDTGDRLAMMVAQEISINHNKQLVSEYLSDDYADTSASMDRLNFTIKSPNRLAGQGLQLLGARYCTIQGQIAAQLSLKNSEGELATLYVTQSTAELKSLHNSDQPYENLLIQSWHEGELFFGLAKGHK